MLNKYGENIQAKMYAFQVHLSNAKLKTDSPLHMRGEILLRKESSPGALDGKVWKFGPAEDFKQC